MKNIAFEGENPNYILKFTLRYYPIKEVIGKSTLSSGNQRQAISMCGI
jgi:hypothetical protein